MMLGFACSSVTSKETPPLKKVPPSDSSPPPLGSEHSDYAGYTLRWQDEFDSGSSIDRTKWNFDTDPKGNNEGWGNTEKQAYTENNAYIDNGALVIEARSESKGGKSYTSARLHTHGLYSVQYGLIEARILLPSNKNGVTDRGTWPAFWLLGNNFDGWGHGQYGGLVGWPWSGEIDIMESNNREHGYTRTSSALHYGTGTEINNSNGSGPTYQSGDTAIGEANTAYHIYGAEWTEDSIRFSLDGQVFFVQDFSTEQEEFKKEYFLLLNLAVGGHFVFDPVSSNYPQELYVDWVRVYQK